MKSPRTLTRLWRAHAKQQGHLTCLQELGESGRIWSWSELLSEVKAHKSQMKKAGLKEGCRVALMDAASNDWVAWMWACFEIGVVWCPIPPSKSEARRSAQRAHCEPHACVEGGVLTAIDVKSPLCPPGSAYLIYTSGTTGEPKGVLVGRDGLLPLWTAQIALFETTPRTRAAWMLSPAFDASVSDIGVALTAGAQLYIVPQGHWLRWEQWTRDMDEHQIDQVDAPPSWLGLWSKKEPPASLRTLIAGGEPASPEILRAWSPRLRWINVYGPTEATVCTSAEHRVVEAGGFAGASIGQPFGHVHYFLGAEDKIEEEGEGELWIGGQAVALGYWKDPVRSNARFVEAHGVRWFKTGDRVEKVGDAWLWKGRVDRQVKRLGKLLNLDEVEAVIMEHPQITHAAAILDARDKLTLFIPSEGPPLSEVKAWCAQRLPDWGMPATIRRVNTFPTNAAGKIDRAALAKEAS